MNERGLPPANTKHEHLQFDTFTVVVNQFLFFKIFFCPFPNIDKIPRIFALYIYEFAFHFNDFMQMKFLLFIGRAMVLLLRLRHRTKQKKLNKIHNIKIEQSNPVHKQTVNPHGTFLQYKAATAISAEYSNERVDFFGNEIRCNVWSKRFTPVDCNRLVNGFFLLKSFYALHTHFRHVDSNSSFGAPLCFRPRF